MKNIIGIVVLVMVVAGCSFADKLKVTKTADPPEASNTTIITAPKSEEPSLPTAKKSESAAGLSLEDFNKLQNGMKYEETVKILGSECVEASSFSSGSRKSVTYKWEGAKYERITAIFRNDELTSKI